MRALACMVLALAGTVHAAEDQRRSGAQFMGESTRAMQRDDTQNPAMLWVADGEALWKASCASCHGDAGKSMRGVAARYPAFDKTVLTLGQRVNACRQKQGAAIFPPESRELLAMESYIALQSRGMPVNPPAGKQLQEATDRGRKLFMQRIGQLNLSCAHCHDANWGKHLAGSTIPQGHANAYPIYRLEWQGVGSLQRRLRNCFSGVRAEVPAWNAQELIDLERYLMVRAKGMPLESPGVRP